MELPQTRKNKISIQLTISQGSVPRIITKLHLTLTSGLQKNTNVLVPEQISQMESRIY